MSRGSSWRSSLICCQTAGSLSHCPDSFLSSLLFFSTQSSFFFFFLPHHPLALSLFFNLIMESSAPLEQAEMLAAGEGIMCQSAGIGALVESIWHGGVELYYCVPRNMKCSSVSQKWWNAVYEYRSLWSHKEISEIRHGSHCHYVAC